MPSGLDHTPVLPAQKLLASMKETGLLEDVYLFHLQGAMDCPTISW